MKKILYIEDEQDEILMVKTRIEDNGYVFVSAVDGEDGVKKVREEAPDLILLDVMMPRKDGYELCQELRSNPSWKDIKIIMLTAKGRDVEREKGLALGADDYITKPFATQEVVEKVKSFLG
jgi:DNA-binding response OmpR family regulator